MADCSGSRNNHHSASDTPNNQVVDLLATKRIGLARVKASTTGLQQVNQARKRKGWAKNAQVWFHLASTSESTLKRFWRQNRICVDSFISICAAVGINDWISIVDWSE